jgi:hypothetical protein
VINWCSAYRITVRSRIIGNAPDVGRGWLPVAPGVTAAAEQPGYVAVRERNSNPKWGVVLRVNDGVLYRGASPCGLGTLSGAPDAEVAASVRTDPRFGGVFCWIGAYSVGGLAISSQESCGSLCLLMLMLWPSVPAGLRIDRSDTLVTTELLVAAMGHAVASSSHSTSADTVAARDSLVDCGGHDVRSLLCQHVPATADAEVN